MKKLQSWKSTLVSVATVWLHLTLRLLLSNLQSLNLISSTLIPVIVLFQNTALSTVDRLIELEGVLKMYSPFQVTFSNLEFFNPVITVCPLDLSIVKFSIIMFSGLSLLVHPIEPVPAAVINLIFVVSILSLVPDCVSPLSITLLGISKSLVKRYSPLGTFK